MEARVSFPDARGFVLKEFVRGMNNNRRAVMSRQIATALFSGFTMRGTEVEDIDDKNSPRHNERSCNASKLRSTGQRVAVSKERI